jgi:ATP-dependent Lhr-like helicase
MNVPHRTPIHRAFRARVSSPGTSPGGFSLAATLDGIVVPGRWVGEESVRLRDDLTPEMWRTVVADAAERLCLPDVDEKALHGLKFSAALPERLAVATLAARLADLDGAARSLGELVRWPFPS